MNEPSVVKRGVPQGSVLGLIMFLIFMNDMFYLGFSVLVAAFADDTVLLSAVFTHTSIIASSNKDLDLLARLFHRNLKLFKRKV